MTFGKKRGFAIAVQPLLSLNGFILCFLFQMICPTNHLVVAVSTVENIKQS